MNRRRPDGMRAWRARRAVVMALLALAGLAACGGGGGSDAPTLAMATPIDCGAGCAADALTAAEVEQVVAQAVVAAQARGQRATIAVADRVGNVLAVYAMTGAAATFTIDGGRAVTGLWGKMRIQTLPFRLR